MSDLAFQDCYPDDYSHCYGCGRLNVQGHQIKSFWDGDEGVCRILPRSCYSGGMKDILYGGLIASLMDCHGAGTAAAAKARELGIEVKPGALPRFVTASLKVDYRSPTPVGKEVELRAKVIDIEGRKVRVSVTLATDGTVRAQGELLMIQLKEE
ncbi:MAG: PaaI family thioesterase [Desulfofustis sp.]|nr:PaaI family thioesterase [Desulfofustis sp.]NNK56976.1 PaaI family thioesterase [Desulfofustis sp.]